MVRRIAVVPGVEMLIDEQHPVLRLNGDTAAIAQALRSALELHVDLLPGVGHLVLERDQADCRPR